MLIYTQLQHKESGQWRTISYSDDDKNLFYEHGELYETPELARAAWEASDEYKIAFPQPPENSSTKTMTAHVEAIFQLAADLGQNKSDSKPPGEFIRGEIEKLKIELSIKSEMLINSEKIAEKLNREGQYLIASKARLSIEKTIIKDILTGEYEPIPVTFDYETELTDLAITIKKRLDDAKAALDYQTITIEKYAETIKRESEASCKQRERAINAENKVEALESVLSGAIARLETIQETHPDIALASDIGYYKTWL